ncbi:MAG: hypothetical protein HQK75_20940, partial [Candidatus Magnetomorum sp.]|nr:hypothetical protein [Candidatus Magnetomorum sp.]
MDNAISPKKKHLNDKVHLLKNQLLNDTITFIAIMAIPSFLASLYQMQRDGFQKIMLVYWVAYACFLGITVFSRYVSYTFRLTAVLAIWMIVGVTGLFSWELMPFILPVLLSVSIFGTIFLSYRFGFFGLGMTVLTVVSVYMALQFQWIDYPADLKLYICSHATWINAIVCVVSLGGVLVFSLGKLQKEYFSAMHSLDEQNQNLLLSEKRQKESELKYNTLFGNMLDAFAVHE